MNISWPDGRAAHGAVPANRIAEDPFSAPRGSRAIRAFEEHAHDSLSSFLRQWHRKDPLALAATLPAPTAPPTPPPPTPRASLAPGRTARRSASPLAAFDTRLRPVVQMGPFDLTAETDLVVPGIFRAANAFATAPGGNRTVLDWTSGYFGLREDYKRLALQCKAKVRIVSASPEVRPTLVHPASDDVGIPVGGRGHAPNRARRVQGYLTLELAG